MSMSLKPMFAWPNRRTFGARWRQRACSARSAAHRSVAAAGVLRACCLRRSCRCRSGSLRRRHWRMLDRLAGGGEGGGTGSVPLEERLLVEMQGAFSPVGEGKGRWCRVRIVGPGSTVLDDPRGGAERVTVPTEQRQEKLRTSIVPTHPSRRYQSQLPVSQRPCIRS